MKALIIGSNGYIGRHLIRVLQENGASLACSDIGESARDEVEDYQQIDIKNRHQVSRLDMNVDYVFVFAGLTGTKESFENYQDFIAVNETGLLNILNEICQQNARPKVVFPSTRLVYKGSHELLSEESPKELKTIYASNKFACENYLKLYHDYYGIPYTIFRICVPYGHIIGNEYSYGTVGFFINQAAQTGQISLYGDGSQRRTFTHIDDIAHLIIQTIKQLGSCNEIFNVGGENLSVYEVATLIADKYQANVITKPWPDLDWRLESGSTIFDSTKIDNLIGYSYQYSFARWLKQL